MGITLTKPTPGDAATDGAWGTTVNAALDELANADVFARKTADETVTSSTTLQDDDHLTMALGVGTYVVQAMYHVSGAAAGDVKVAWAFSGTATASYRGGQGPGVSTTDATAAAAAATTVGVVRAAAAGGTTAAITSSVPYGVDGTNWSHIQELGLMVVTVAGTLKVQWAQNTSNATGTIMRTGSWLWAHRVA